MNELDVLIIEDDAKIAEIQRRFVDKVEGFRVVGIAHSVGEAEDLLEVLQPHLVLLDIYFPDGNGLELLRHIRSWHHHTDVILITAAKEVAALQEAMRLGVFDYIIKPVVFQRLQEALQKFQTYLQKFQQLHQLEQHDVDRLLHSATGSARPAAPAPKGIDPLTLEKIKAVLAQHPQQPLSAEQVGQLVGASRTTARRYLEYLLSNGEIKADLEYGTVGRPERRYSALS